MTNYVHFFGAGHADGNAQLKTILGGKGANLAEMTNLGIPVPPGFTISAELCNTYIARGTYPPELKAEVEANLAKLETLMGRTFGAAKLPLLVSVRSGAAVSMPGMMDTILNLGMNDQVAEGLAQEMGNPQFAYDAYRRFVQMYGDVVMGLKGNKSPFEALLHAKKEARGVKRDIDLSAADLKALVAEYKAALKRIEPRGFPEEPKAQLWGAIEAVWRSWQGDRAVTYRRLHGVPETLGTAVNVQTMVFGNLGEDSGTGVAFTRDPSTGEHRFFGEFLVNAQGEDVVAGIRTPQSIEEMAQKFPKAYEQLVATYQRLEKHYRDMQDLEFTVERGTLYLLQTRNGKRTGAAAVKIAVDMVKEGLITKEEALLRVSPDALDQLLHPMIDPAAPITLLAKGLPASPGAASGQAVFTADEAFAWAGEGKAVILVREETSPEDIKGMAAAKGILTARGGMTSHAAVVARGMGKCCVAGAKDVHVDADAGSFTAGGKTIKRGDWITLDGSNGRVIQGKVPTVEATLGDYFGEFMGWADEVRKLKVRTNADTPGDAARARGFGAEGIGLTRTEHMFFEGDRIKAMREMILAENLAGRKKALTKLLAMQRKDFYGILKAMKGYGVTIRLLDPPLHEFVPHEDKNQKEMARQLKVPVSVIKAKVESLHEFNPMLGHRGCRLGITYPEITEMQARAIFEAAAEVQKSGIKVKPEVMIPLVGFKKELDLQAELVHRVAKEVMAEKKVKISYMVGTMIEVPRGALTADEIAQTAEFFSFGTNDLTQTCLGMSRDDSGSFLPPYAELEICKTNPFASIDQAGVGQLMKIAVEKGNQGRPGIKLGICGEHGGDPNSVKFCHKLGLTYVSCSPFRVPVARLAAAQAALEEEADAKAKGAKKASKAKR